MIPEAAYAMLACARIGDSQRRFWRLLTSVPARSNLIPIAKQ